LVTTPLNKGTIPYSLDAIFRTAMTEFNGVGETLTKALATRAAENTKQVGNRGIPPTMASGGMRSNEASQPTKVFPVPT
jgi:hypothetical protein